MRIMLGYDREDFASRFSSQALLGMPSGLQTPTAVAGWLRQADNGVEIVLPSRSGASIPVLVNRTALWDEQGAMRYVFAFYTNIAQQKAIEYALTEAKEAAEAASLAKSSFLASMSHELRTPMHAILSYSGLGLEKAEGGSVYRPLMGEGTLAERVRPTAFAGLSVIPSEFDLCGAEVELARGEDHLNRLRRAMAPLREDGRFDVILIDCPPSLGLITLNAFAAADRLIVPLQCEYYALDVWRQCSHHCRR